MKRRSPLCKILAFVGASIIALSAMTIGTFATSEVGSSETNGLFKFDTPTVLLDKPSNLKIKTKGRSVLGYPEIGRGSIGRIKHLPGESTIVKSDKITPLAGSDAVTYAYSFTYDTSKAIVPSLIFTIQNMPVNEQCVVEVSIDGRDSGAYCNFDEQGNIIYTGIGFNLPYSTGTSGYSYGKIYITCGNINGGMQSNYTFAVSERFASASQTAAYPINPATVYKSAAVQGLSYYVNFPNAYNSACIKTIESYGRARGVGEYRDRIMNFYIEDANGNGALSNGGILNVSNHGLSARGKVTIDAFPTGPYGAVTFYDIKTVINYSVDMYEVWGWE